MNWLIEKENIKFLNPVTDISTIGVNHLSLELISQDTIKRSLKTFESFLTTSEVKSYNSKKSRIKKSDWRKIGLFVNVKYIEDKSFKENMVRYSLTEPIFLNKQNTRVIIGEYFTCGLVCGRGDLLLCEYKNNAWQIVARGNVYNE